MDSQCWMLCGWHYSVHRSTLLFFNLSLSHTAEQLLLGYRGGEVWTVNLDPMVGSEQGKSRPALVIQNDIGNRYSPVVIVAAISSGQTAHYDTQVEVKAPEGGLQHDSLVLLNQIRTVDKQRLSRFRGRLSSRQ